MGTVMEQAELERMSVDDLWTLYVETSGVLQQRSQLRKLELEERLKRLQNRQPAPSSVSNV